MSDTPTLYEFSIDDPEAASTEFGSRVDAYGPDSSETPTPVNEPVETKPVSWDGPNDQKNPQNWSASKKWLVMSVNAITTVNVCVVRSRSSNPTADHS